mmetsp:Transcript_16407/g.26326  ORF Transcript_16407/g.26326 Transcript_16407/m.26326 type:complete len:245 (+) Transcript_16407:74-808(+)
MMPTNSQTVTTLKMQLQNKLTSLRLHVELRTLSDRLTAKSVMTRSSVYNFSQHLDMARQEAYYLQGLHDVNSRAERGPTTEAKRGDMEAARDALLKERVTCQFSLLQAEQADAQIDELNRIINADEGIMTKVKGRIGHKFHLMNDMQADVCLHADDTPLQLPNPVLPRRRHSNQTPEYQAGALRLAARGTKSESPRSEFRRTESQDSFSSLSQASGVATTDNSLFLQMLKGNEYEDHQAGKKSD